MVITAPVLILDLVESLIAREGHAITAHDHAVLNHFPRFHG
jgi:hypothetical protein